jgi:carboxyl-terminal processing protease
MSRRFSWFVVILAVASLANLFMRGGMLGALSTRTEVKREQYPALIGDVMRGIEDNYAEEVDARKLLYGALYGMVFSLGDPHSNFIEPDAYKQMQENTQGHFGGLGIIIGMKDGCLTVISPLKGKPAEPT